MPSLAQRLLPLHCLTGRDNLSDDSGSKAETQKVGAGGTARGVRPQVSTILRITLLNGAIHSDANWLSQALTSAMARTSERV